MKMAKYWFRIFFRKKEFEGSGSLTRIAWKRFLNNRLSFAAFIFILISILIAVLGYLITPDPSPYANQQYLELGTKKPGFAVKMLKVRNNEDTRQGSVLNWMLSGRRSVYTLYPFEKIEFNSDSLLLQEFTGDAGIRGEEKIFSLPDIIYPLMHETFVTSSGQDQVSFILSGGQKSTASLTKMNEEIQKHHIIKKRFLLGSDQFGRDILSRLMIGTRVSLSVGLISVLISLVIGITIGAAGGFFRGWIDNFVVWLINVVWSIPTLLLVIAITFALGKGFWQVFVAVGLTMWVEVARVARGQIMSIREKEFVEAGRALGYSNFRIIFRHILPNIMGPIIVISAANFASAVLIEAGLSFLGIGVQPPMPSWGSMLRENYHYIILDKAYLALLPGMSIMLMVLAFMIIGNGLRDALDVRIVEKNRV